MKNNVIDFSPSKTNRNLYFKQDPQNMTMTFKTSKNVEVGDYIQNAWMPYSVFKGVIVDILEQRKWTGNGARVDDQFYKVKVQTMDRNKWNNSRV